LAQGEIGARSTPVRNRFHDATILTEVRAR
jgi:hypothetical protein